MCIYFVIDLVGHPSLNPSIYVSLVCIAHPLSAAAESDGEDIVSTEAVKREPTEEELLHILYKDSEEVPRVPTPRLPS